MMISISQSIVVLTKVNGISAQIVTRIPAIIQYLPVLPVTQILKQTTNTMGLVDISIKMRLALLAILPEMQMEHSIMPIQDFHLQGHTRQ
jgi:hypothetical protein